MSVLPATTTSDHRSTGDPLIAVFEDEQKNAVFSALSEYLHQDLFCDVTLVVGHQILRAHKVVLASSSKFFYNVFSHFPTLTSIDLERELVAHGISVTFDDIRLIIGILYCVGTVEISPQRVESLLLMAQILGIPSLIRFLKKIKESLINDQESSSTPVKKALVYVQVPTSSQKIQSLTFEHSTMTTSFFQSQGRRFENPDADTASADNHRSGSRATLASLSSFPFHPISSPVNEPNNLDTLELLNNLQANQIDDLENALLPHLQGESDLPTFSSSSNGQQVKKSRNEESLNSTLESRSGSSNNLELLLPQSNTPKGCSTPKRSNCLNISLHEESTFSINDHDPTTYETMNMEQFNQLLPSHQDLDPEPDLDQDPEPDPVSTSSNDLVIDEDALHEQDGATNEDDDSNTEFKIPLNKDEAKEGKVITLKLPGSSQSFTLNFSPDALNKMTRSLRAENFSVKKKSAFSCQLCSKCFPSRRMLNKHEKYHVDKNSSCDQCGEVFNQKWKLEQHKAKAHTDGQSSLECKDCGKVFQWHRNLLAHINLHHQKEIRYRCKNCPLTFLKKKAFIYHHREKHKEAPEPWCQLCLEIFDGSKQRDDHSCGKFENTGRSLICHKHDPPMEFKHQADLSEHIVQAHNEDPGSLSNLQKSCPVCSKKFLLRKNLMTHLKRLHETEGSGAGRPFACTFCPKSFFSKAEKDGHENTHRGAKDFKCHCGKAYSSQKALDDHTKLMHGETKVVYSCDICGKVLRDKYKLKYHMMVHSEKRNFKCSHCSTEFKGGENLRKHVQKFHAEAIISAN